METKKEGPVPAKPAKGEEYIITLKGKDKKFVAEVGKRKEYGRDVDVFNIVMSDMWTVEADIEKTSKPLIDLCPNDTYHGKLVDGTKKKKENQYIAVIVYNSDGDNVGGYGFTDNEKKALFKMGYLEK